MQRTAPFWIVATLSLVGADAAAQSDAVAASVTDPYGLTALWQSGDLVARATLTMLVLMSASTWYVILTKLVQQSIINAYGREVDRRFWTAGSVANGVVRLGARSAFAALARAGLAAAGNHDASVAQEVDRATWVSMTLDRHVAALNARLQGGLALLATVASTAPFVGLFGTVWGIYHALTAIGIAGQASLDRVAGPVGEALIMTAIGLATAVPAVLGYNLLLRRNRAAMERVRDYAADLQAAIVFGRRVGTPAPVRVAAGFAAE